MTEIRLYLVAVLVLGPLCLWSWHREEPTAVREDVYLIDAAGARFDSARWVTRTSTITVEQRDDYIWLTETRDPQKPRGFVGSEKAESLVERLTELQAIRSLGRPEDAAPLGFEGDRLEVRWQSGQSARFEVGGRTNGNSGDYYVRDDSGEVFLVSASLFTDLDAPGRFRQRKLRDAPLSDVARIQVALGEAALSAVQQNRRSPRDAFWALAETPEEKAAAVDALVKTLERVTILEYPETEPPPETWMEVTWLDGDDQPLGRAAFARTEDGLWARSDQTHRWGTVPRPVLERLQTQLEEVFPAP